MDASPACEGELIAHNRKCTLSGPIIRCVFRNRAQSDPDKHRLAKGRKHHEINKLFKINRMRTVPYLYRNGVAPSSVGSQLSITELVGYALVQPPKDAPAPVKISQSPLTMASDCIRKPAGSPTIRNIGLNRFAVPSTCPAFQFVRTIAIASTLIDNTDA